MDIAKILADHKKWLNGDEGGAKANLRRANLRRANLRDADLSGADLSGANLSEADLRGANLRWANLREANLRRADLREANLRRADLRRADLREADLRGANLRWADLSGADLRRAGLSGANLSEAKGTSEIVFDEHTAFYNSTCPEAGAYIGYKKAGGLIVELGITEDALRSSATSRKCRASKAKVLSITDKDGNPAGNSVASDYDSSFVYIVGEVVEVKNFDADRWNECSAGIHHFITRGEAVMYGC